MYYWLWFINPSLKPVNFFKRKYVSQSVIAWSVTSLGMNSVRSKYNMFSTYAQRWKFSKIFLYAQAVTISNVGLISELRSPPPLSLSLSLSLSLFCFIWFCFGFFFQFEKKKKKKMPKVALYRNQHLTTLTMDHLGIVRKIFKYQAFKRSWTRKWWTNEKYMYISMTQFISQIFLYI